MVRPSFSIVSLRFSLIALLLSCLSAGNLFGEIVFEPTWNIPTYGEVRSEVFEWIESGKYGEELATSARAIWPTVDLRDSSGTELLDRVIETLVLVEPKVARFVEACDHQQNVSVLPDATLLEFQQLAEFARSNLSLYYARWLAQRGLYDEVLDTLDGLETADVVDPASLLFYRTLAYHQLVEPEKSRALLVQLMEHEESLPQRFQHVAQLLERDLQGLKDESLDHIARRMNDVRRRLEFGRAGKTVQMAEDKVLDSLDKLIDKLEKQAQQQSSSGSSGAQQSNQPMQDSKLPSMNSPMQVDQKDIGNKSGWGDLPPKQRQEALQQIGRDFPAHYRELVEQYFRELADDNKTPEK